METCICGCGDVNKGGVHQTGELILDLCWVVTLYYGEGYVHLAHFMPIV